MLLGGLWLVFHHPLAFLVLLGVFLAFVIWFVPKLLRFLRRVWDKLSGREAQRALAEN
jgi:hypothetical protein